jgi:hypothetical protein
MKAAGKILGYGWAVLAIPLVLATFLGMQTWPGLLAKSTGVQVSPRMTGGEVARTIAHGSYETRIHRPVFDGLLGPRARGFVQVDWVATPPATALPDRIAERVDYDADGTADFSVELDVKANHAIVKPLRASVLGFDHVIVLKNGRVLRIDLKRE